VFVTWDDCGCFYDQVNPLQYDPTWGIRVPVLMAGPYVRAGFTDSTPTSFAGILAYVEHTFGLPAMSASDATAYDFAGSFDYSQTPLAPVHMLRERVPKASLAYIAKHPQDPNDPT
jgi:phospholipase C